MTIEAATVEVEGERLVEVAVVLGRHQQADAVVVRSPARIVRAKELLVHGVALFDRATMTA